MRWLLAGIFLLSGVLHIVLPAPYIEIVPPWLPRPALLVALSGGAELAGGIGLLLPATQRLAGISLILLLIAVFPANIQMLLLYRTRGTPWWAELLLWLRLPLQLLLIWGVWRVSQRPRR